MLMDIMMPEMDGYETMEIIRQKPEFKHLPILALDGQGDEGRPRKVPAGRRIGLHRQAGQHRPAAVADARLAASVRVLAAVRQVASLCNSPPASKAWKHMKTDR